MKSVKHLLKGSVQDIDVCLINSQTFAFGQFGPNFIWDNQKIVENFDLIYEIKM